MPMYEYQCAACGHQDTLLQKVQAARSSKCPSCGKPRSFKRQISAPSFQLKGTGWYVTDFRDSKKKPAAAGSEASPASDSKKAGDGEKKVAASASSKEKKKT